MASIHKRLTPSGDTRWEVRYRDPNRTDRSKSFQRKSDAARFAASVEADINRGEWIDPTLGRETFGYWAEQWLVTTYRLKPKTQEGYRSVLNHHLLPKLGNTPVGRIDLATASALLSELTQDGAGAGTVGNIRGVLNLVLEQARRSGAIRTNPVADTKPPRKPHQEMVFLTAEQIIAVATEITSPPIKTRGGEHSRRSFPERGLLVRLAGFTGLRAGEITALKVSALDLTTMRVRVLLAASEAYGQLHIGPPKTWRRRSVPLPGGLAEDLAHHIRGKSLGAIDRSAEMLLNSGADIRVACLPAEQDPADILSEGGTSRFANLIDSAAHLPVHLVDRIVDKHNIDEVEGPLRALVEAAQVVGHLDARNKPTVVQHLANRINRDSGFVAEVLKRHTPDLSRNAGRDMVHGLTR